MHIKKISTLPYTHLTTANPFWLKLQAPSPTRFGDTCAEISGKMSDNFMAEFKFEDLTDKGSSKIEALEEKGNNFEEEEEKKEEEFSFACTNLDGSVISADDVFQDGQIRPMYRVFNQDHLLVLDASATHLPSPLKKVFVQEEERYRFPEGKLCTWSGKTTVLATPEACKKSNSTGFSKLWRFRDLGFRSKSDGKDAFVLLNPFTTPSNIGKGKSSSGEGEGEKKTNTSTEARKKSNSTGFSKLWRFRDLGFRCKSEGKDAFVFLNSPTIPSNNGKDKSSSGEKKTKTKRAVGGKGKEKKVKGKTTSSAHEKFYAGYRERKEGEKRKSYLPYKKDLLMVGFFASVNGLSRNIHPF